MQVKSIDTEGVMVFRVQGRLDAATSGTLETALLQGIGPETRKVVLDVSDVDYVSSGGLRVILLLAKQMNACAGKMAVFGVSRSVEGVFRISGLSRIVSVLPDEAQALAAVIG